MSDPRRPIDVFLASIGRPEKLGAMIESVGATGYPARVLVAAGDDATVETVRRFPGLAECATCPEADRRPGCTASLNMVYRRLVRRDALFCTDDCLFAPDALDVAAGTLLAHFPDTDGVVGLAQENIPDGYDLAFPLMGRAFLDRFDGLASVFWPGYYHLYNDVEMGLTAKCLGNWVFEPRARLRHAHPEMGGGTFDATHHRGLARAEHDRAAFAERRARGALWGIDEEPCEAPPPVR